MAPRRGRVDKCSKSLGGHGPTVQLMNSVSCLRSRLKLKDGRECPGSNDGDVMHQSLVAAQKAQACVHKERLAVCCACPIPIWMCQTHAQGL
jgi:hypothetical protein